MRRIHHGDTESTEKRRGEEIKWTVPFVVPPLVLSSRLLLPFFSVLSVSPW
jgi:hypothetical protein